MRRSISEDDWYRRGRRFAAAACLGLAAVVGGCAGGGGFNAPQAGAPAAAPPGWEVVFLPPQTAALAAEYDEPWYGRSDDRLNTLDESSIIAPEDRASLNHPHRVYLARRAEDYLYFQRPVPGAGHYSHWR